MKQYKPDSVVLYGPAGSGKSRNAPAIAQHLGLSLVVDEAALLLSRGTVELKGVLYVSEQPGPAGIKSVHITEALDWLGKVPFRRNT